MALSATEGALRALRTTTPLHSARSRSDGGVANKATAQQTSDKMTRKVFNNMLQPLGSMPLAADEVAWLQAKHPPDGCIDASFSGGFGNTWAGSARNGDDSTDHVANSDNCTR